MKVLEKENYIELLPDDGKYLYDGNVISERVFTPKDSADKWNEISSADAEIIKQEIEQEAEEERKKLEEKRASKLNNINSLENNHE